MCRIVWVFSACVLLIRMATAVSAEPVAQFRAHAGRVNCLHVSPDGQSLVTSGEDATTRIWTVGEIEPQHILAGKVVTVSPDWKRLVTSSSDGLRLWDLQTGKVVTHSNDVRVHCSSLAWSPNGKTIAACPRTGTANTVVLCDAKTLEKKLTINTDTTQLFTCTFSPDGRIVAVGGPLRPAQEG